MGGSTDAQLFFGVDLEDCEGDWYGCKWWSNPGLIAEYGGKPCQPECKGGHEEDWNDFYESSNHENTLLSFGCMGVLFGWAESRHGPYIALAVKESFISTSADNLESVDHIRKQFNKKKYLEQLTQFAEARGVTFNPDKASWKLCGMVYP